MTMTKCQQCGGFAAKLPGKNICVSCQAENEANAKAIEALQEEGHPYHCACRQVWGDGECECGLYQGKYDPYWWQRSNDVGGNKA